MEPFVSVVMTIYNGQSYLKESINSILEQQYQNFEFIIVNDGSSDHSDKIVLSYSDKRIKYFQFLENQGVVNRLNFAFEKANGVYIVKMDQDDISKRDRIEKQVRFMENHLDIGICGSYVRLFGAKTGIWKMPTTNDEIKAALINGSPFCHPSVIFRKQVIIDNKIKYSDGFNLTDDYELWTQLFSVTKFANLNIPLLHYRISEEQVSFKRKKEQDQQIQVLRKRLLDAVYEISESEFNLIFNIQKTVSVYNKFEIESIISILEQFSKRNSQLDIFHKSSFKKQLGYNLLSVFVGNNRIWFSHILWAYRNGYLKGLSVRMHLGLMKKMISHNEQ